MYFLLNLSHCMCQSYGNFLSNFGSFYHAHIPNMVMSRDQVENFECFYFFLILKCVKRKLASLGPLLKWLF